MKKFKCDCGCFGKIDISGIHFCPYCGNPMGGLEIAVSLPHLIQAKGFDGCTCAYDGANCPHCREHAEGSSLGEVTFDDVWNSQPRDDREKVVAKTWFEVGKLSAGPYPRQAKEREDETTD